MPIANGWRAHRIGLLAVRAISGTPLRDSYHLGSTIVNDYGRPYENGFNNYSGASGYASQGRFLIYVRGEFQGAPRQPAIRPRWPRRCSNADNIPFINPATGLPYNQATIPLGPIAATTNGRFIEAYVSVHCSTMKFPLASRMTGWGLGWAAAWPTPTMPRISIRSASTASNRCTSLAFPDHWSFPLRFLVGSLKGHTYPNDPWVHVEKISFRPTQNLEFGFERTVIWGGKDHEPITLHTFLQKFLQSVGSQ